jgi:hypothetical protein
MTHDYLPFRNMNLGSAADQQPAGGGTTGRSRPFGPFVRHGDAGGGACSDLPGAIFRSVLFGPGRVYFPGRHGLPDHPLGHAAAGLIFKVAATPMTTPMARTFKNFGIFTLSIMTTARVAAVLTRSWRAQGLD